MIQQMARRLAPLMSAAVLGSDIGCGNRECQERGSRWRRMRNPGLRANGDWFCSPACLEQRIFHECAERPSPTETQHRMRLGMILLARQAIDENRLRSALTAQQRTGERIGECLARQGLVTAQQVTSALAAQWQCPGVYGVQQLAAAAAAIPLSLLRECRMVPIGSASGERVVSLMFDGAVDHSALYAVQQMLGRRTTPCIGSAMLIEQMLSQAESQARDVEVNFGHATAEMISRTSRSYAEELDGSEIRYVSFGGRFWMRIGRQLGAAHLVFSAKTMYVKSASDLPMN